MAVKPAIADDHGVATLGRELARDRSPHNACAFGTGRPVDALRYGDQ